VLDGSTICVTETYRDMPDGRYKLTQHHSQEAARGDAVCSPFTAIVSEKVISDPM